MAQCLQQRMYTMLTNNTLTDVTFIVQGEQIKGHKAVIASYGGLLKEYVEKNNQIIDIGDIISPETFKTVLQYIYTDEIVITKSNILEILHAASEFSLKSLVQMCVKHLAKRLSCGNLEEMSKQASLFKSQELLNVCIQYFGNNTQRIIESKEFLAFSEDVLKTLCSSHQIDCLDVELFSSCVKWAENRCKSLNRQCTPENLRIALGDTLQKIRFSSMSMEEFLESVVKTKILTMTEVGQVITDILENKDPPKSPHYKRVLRDEADTMASEAQVTEAEADGAAKEAHVTKEADAPANANTCVCGECNLCKLQQETGIMSCHTTAATDVPVSPLVNQGLVQPCCSNIKVYYPPQQPMYTQTQPQQYQQRRTKKMLTITDPNTGKCIMEDIMPNSSHSTTPPNSGSSSLGATPVGNTPLPANNDIAAQFAAQVAATLRTAGPPPTMTQEGLMPQEQMGQGQMHPGQGQIMGQPPLKQVDVVSPSPPGPGIIVPMPSHRVQHRSFNSSFRYKHT